MLLSNKLISLLNTFSKHDLNRFKKYLASPFFNENPDIEKLYSIVCSYLKLDNKEEKLIEKIKIWNTVYPKKKYSDIKMRRLSSDLIRHSYSFLAHKGYKLNPLTEQIFLLKSLNEPTRKKHFEGIIKQIENTQKKLYVKNSDYYYYKFLIQHNQYIFNEKSRKDFSKELKKADFYIDCYYFLNKLKSYCDILSYKNFLPLESEIKMIPSFFSYLEKENFLSIPSINAYYLVTKMLLNPQQEEFFYKLSSVLLKERGNFDKSELSSLYTHLINYCIHKKINIGKTEFFKELFELYKITLNYLNVNEKFDLHRYKNIVTVGLHIKEYLWIENFIQTYTNNLPKEHRENALTYNLAKVYFSQKKYDKVIEQLREVADKNPVYALGGKLILLKTYYELQEYQPLDSLIDSFRIYIRRNKLISREVKQQYLNLLRFVKKLSSTISGDKKALEKIRLQIDKCKALAGKKWILEKVEELS